LSLLKADEATHIDELIEKLESGMSSSEIFAARFELELNSRVRQMPGKNFVKRFGKRLAVSSAFRKREEVKCRVLEI